MPVKASRVLILPPSVPDLLLTVKPAASHYTAGQSITLTCSLTTTRTVEGFIFIKDGSKLGSFQAFGQQSKSYHLPSLSGKSTGRYSCKYWKKSYHGQNFTFLESNTVWISVRGEFTGLKDVTCCGFHFLMGLATQPPVGMNTHPCACENVGDKQNKIPAGVDLVFRARQQGGRLEN